MARSSGSQVLILLALAGVLVGSAPFGVEAWRDSGSFALVLFGVPALCALVALVVERSTTTMVAPAVVAVLGLVCTGWSLLTGLGIGLVFLVPAFLLLLAAFRSWGDRAASGPVRT